MSQRGLLTIIWSYTHTSKFFSALYMQKRNIAMEYQNKKWSTLPHVALKFSLTRIIQLKMRKNPPRMQSTLADII